MTKIIEKIKHKFAQTTNAEIPLDDLSVWNENEKGEKTTPVYIETEYISGQCNEFRKDYRKVIMCIITLKDGKGVPACRKLYNTFVSKWQLDEMNPNSKSVTHQHDQMLKVTICGYIENLLQQLETKYACVYSY